MSSPTKSCSPSPKTLVSLVRISARIAVDDILRQGVQGISDIITIPGIINRDFADVKAIMAGMGYAVMGTASASGAKRTIEAAQKAIASPLLEAGAIDGARGILINITGSTSLKLAEVQQACSIIQSAAHEDANIIFGGAVMDEKMKDSVKITVIRYRLSAKLRPLAIACRKSAHRSPPRTTTPWNFPRLMIRESRIRAISFPSHPGTSWNRRSPDENMMDDRSYADDVTPMPMSYTSDRMA